jgi:hypothetical protein
MAKDHVTKFDAVAGGIVTVTTSDNIEDCTNAADVVAVNDVVYLNADNQVAKASATSAHRVFGIVFEITDSTHCRVITGGLIEGFSTGMSIGDDYFLAENGALHLVPDPYHHRIGFAFNATDLFLRIEKPQAVVMGSCLVTTLGGITLTTKDTWYSWTGLSPAVWADVDEDLFTHADGVLTHIGGAHCWALCSCHIYASSTTIGPYHLGISHNGDDPDLYSTMRLAGTANSFTMQRAIYVAEGDTLELMMQKPGVDGCWVQVNTGSWFSAVGLNLK